ncbi:hypothetical protein Droror1_Dr00011832 [Drosera rotundifolia]
MGEGTKASWYMMVRRLFSTWFGAPSSTYKTFEVSSPAMSTSNPEALMVAASKHFSAAHKGATWAQFSVALEEVS